VILFGTKRLTTQNFDFFKKKSFRVENSRTFAFTSSIFPHPCCNSLICVGVFVINKLFNNNNNDNNNFNNNN
jgi:hypothetical protein